MEWSTKNLSSIGEKKSDKVNLKFEFMSNLI